MNIEGKTNAELTAMQAKIEADPANRSPAVSLFIFMPNARKKLDAISRQITHNLGAARAARGDPVPTCGYSGRQTNRR